MSWILLSAAVLFTVVVFACWAASVPFSVTCRRRTSHISMSTSDHPSICITCGELWPCSSVKPREKETS